MGTAPTARGRTTDLPSAARTLTRLLGPARLLGLERVGIDQADGRVLGEDLVAVAPLPAETHATRDGFALAVADLVGAGPWTLLCEGEARAGNDAEPLVAGRAARISTGAPLPAGADCVVAQEEVARERSAIVVAKRPTLGQHVRPTGSDVAAGATALQRGVRLTPGRLAVAAALGREALVVARRPVFAVMATGDELAIRGRPGPPPVRESTSHAVCAWLRRAGALPRLMPALPDDLGTTAEALSVAARGADAIVTIGGVGPGDHDHVRPALRWLDAELETEGVAIRPGRPFSAGRLGEIPVLCLPGTPGAAMLTCVLFAVPLARAMQGDRSPVSRRTPLRIVGSHVQHTRHEELLRARLELHDEELCAILMPEQASASIAGFAEADALVFVAPARKGIRNGERHPVMRLADV